MNNVFLILPETILETRVVVYKIQISNMRKGGQFINNWVHPQGSPENNRYNSPSEKSKMGRAAPFF